MDMSKLRARAKVRISWPGVRIVTFPDLSPEEREEAKRQVRAYANDPLIRELRRQAQASRDAASRARAQQG